MPAAVSFEVGALAIRDFVPGVVALTLNEMWHWPPVPRLTLSTVIVLGPGSIVTEPVPWHVVNTGSVSATPEALTSCSPAGSVSVNAIPVRLTVSLSLKTATSTVTVAPPTEVDVGLGV